MHADNDVALLPLLVLGPGPSGTTAAVDRRPAEAADEAEFEHRLLCGVAARQD